MTKRDVLLTAVKTAKLYSAGVRSGLERPMGIVDDKDLYRLAHAVTVLADVVEQIIQAKETPA